MTLQVDDSTAFVLAVSPARGVPLEWEALTVSLDGHAVQVQAGAGIVADSEPTAEYEETLNKARGLLKALACLDGEQR